MFEQFDESTRRVVTHALGEARRQRHSVVGGDHLPIGVAHAEPPLIDASLKALRAAVTAVRGEGDGDPVGTLPLTAEANKALKRAASVARAGKQEVVMPAHVLLALLAVDPLVGSVLASVHLGNARADSRLLEAVLAADGPVAAALREHGLDEDAVRALGGGAAAG